VETQRTALAVINIQGGKKRELVKQGPNTKPIVVEGSKTKEL
jgi:hypothetical protein